MSTDTPSPAAEGRGGKLTEAQRQALAWLPDAGGIPGRRTWMGKMFGSPDKGALRTCLSRGWAVRVGHPDMDLYARTPAGREALSRKKANG